MSAPFNHNQPDAHTLSAETIHDLLEEAKHWLDGSEVTSEADADGVSRLLIMLRRAQKDADEGRKAERKPHDDAVKVVQTKWKPLLEQADMAMTACKRALAPFLRRQEEAKRAAELAATRQAEEKADAARKAALAASDTDLDALTELKGLQEDAERARRDAERIARTKVAAKGGERAVTLRTSYYAVVTDYKAAAAFYWRSDRPEFEALIDRLAQRDVRAGRRSISGAIIQEQRVAV